MNSLSCHVDPKRITWFGWMNGLESKFDRVCDCVCSTIQFKVEQQRDVIVAGTPETFFTRYLINGAALEVVGSFATGHQRGAFMHARTDYTSRYTVGRWTLAPESCNGTHIASQQRQDFVSCSDLKP